MSKALASPMGGPLADLEAILGNATMTSQAMDYGILGVSAAGGLLAGEAVRRYLFTKTDGTPRVPSLLQPLILVGGGFAAGLLLQKFDRRVAAGVAAGLIGSGLASLVAALITKFKSGTTPATTAGMGRSDANDWPLVAGRNRSASRLMGQAFGRTQVTAGPNVAPAANAPGGNIMVMTRGRRFARAGL